ncbi:hypothetical protein K227x_33820 [Rubripirellula lacrimiformis]|uniref:Uncharacterized protein n=1 Tax=Rubripirellula lacrimiformis TaxID=1930273 RepID=A0A517NCW9_9BACT|nr:hypothetical protein K227x_33820 [Rubripirellula lacrimiformis]
MIAPDHRLASGVWFHQTILFGCRCRRRLHDRSSGPMGRSAYDDTPPLRSLHHDVPSRWSSPSGSQRFGCAGYLSYRHDLGALRCAARCSPPIPRRASPAGLKSRPSVWWPKANHDRSDRSAIDVGFPDSRATQFAQKFLRRGDRISPAPSTASGSVARCDAGQESQLGGRHDGCGGVLETRCTRDTG